MSLPFFAMLAVQFGSAWQASFQHLSMVASVHCRHQSFKASKHARYNGTTRDNSVKMHVEYCIKFFIDYLLNDINMNSMDSDGSKCIW